MLERLKSNVNYAKNLSVNLRQAGHPLGLLLLSSLTTASGPSYISPDESAGTVLAFSIPSGLLRLSSRDDIEEGYDNQGNWGAYNNRDDNVSFFLPKASVSWSSTAWVSYNTITTGNAHAAPLAEQAINSSFFLPGLLNNNTSSRGDFVVTERGISVGSLNTKVLRFHGINPFVVKNIQGEKVSTVENGDEILMLHVNRNPWKYRGLGNIERVKQIRQDFISFCNGLDDPISVGANEEEKILLERFSHASILGVSHLVRLMGRYDQIPTWGIEELPNIVRLVYAADSTGVSFIFGGKRFISRDDVRVAFITPEVRASLIA